MRAKKWRLVRLPVLGAAGGVLLFALLCARPVRVTLDGKSEVIWPWAWQSCEVRFVNSVTGKPVAIRFGAPWRFSGFTAETDPETESYYTGGAYSWNRKLGEERQAKLRYCSEIGISLQLGSKRYEVRKGCLDAELLWPP